MWPRSLVIQFLVLMWKLLNYIIKIENDYNVKSSIFFLDESIKLDLFNIENWKLSMGRYNLFDSEIIKMIQYLDNNGFLTSMLPINRDS